MDSACGLSFSLSLSERGRTLRLWIPRADSLSPSPSGRGDVRCGYGFRVRTPFLPLLREKERYGAVMDSACGLSFSLSLRERGGVRASATQALQVFSPSPHLHTLQTHYSRSVKPAIPGSVASGCGEHRRRASHRADRRPVQSPAVLRSRQNRECRDQRDVGGETYSKQNGGCAVSTIVDVLLALSYV